MGLKTSSLATHGNRHFPSSELRMAQPAQGGLIRDARQDLGLRPLGPRGNLGSRLLAVDRSEVDVRDVFTGIESCMQDLISESTTTADSCAAEA